MINLCWLLFFVLFVFNVFKVDFNNVLYVGGNIWVGGIGGWDIVGLGGKGGLYCLDVGYDVY